MNGPGERELDALMARLADGDRRAFDPLFAALRPRALLLARMRLPPSDAEDAAQQALTRLFARASDFTAGRAVLPWFYAIAANEVHTVARRRGRQRAREADSALADAVPGAGDPEDELVREELRASVRAAIDALDEASVQAIHVLLGEEPPPRNVEAPALRKRVSRAYARLRVLLGGRS